jgi:flagella basal body P-ring formation protein FlgA
MRRLVLSLIAGCCAFADCFPVTQNRILGRDLAAADPQFASLPATLTVGFAPSPGAKRIFDSAELGRIARSNGISVRVPAQVCFELPMRPLQEGEVAAAMRASLPEDTTLSIVELPKEEMPVGQIVFPVAGLQPSNPAAPGSQLWRGYVKYAETRKAAIWARVAVAVGFTAVVAVRDLLANAVIDAAALRIERRTGPARLEKVAARMEDVIGQIPKSAIKAGSPIPLASLARATAVRRGDSVKVEVQSGPAQLRFEAVAETPANEGDVLQLRNPLNGKTFRARLESGRAVLVVPAGHTP